LQNLKESNPIQVAEYAVANKLVEEAAFAWWVPCVLKCRGQIIGEINSRYHKCTNTEYWKREKQPPWAPNGYPAIWCSI